VLLGLAGVAVICGLTPYNDYALGNTYLVGNNLPLGVVLLAFVFVVAVNGPLCRWWPRWSLSSGELAVAFSMTLVSCALPSSGLMRYFPPALVSPLWLSRASPEYTEMLAGMDLPAWIFPRFEGSILARWVNDPVVSGYLERWGYDSPVPYGAWLRPAATWGVFLFALFGAMLCMVAMVRRQWMDNERLAFPLAQIQLALIQAPEPGRWLNHWMRRRAFWVAFSAVFALHVWNGASRYWPLVPYIPVYYNLHELFSERPWVFLDSKVKDAAIFFTVVGVSYFLTTSIALSLWAFYLLEQLRRLYLGMSSGDPSIHGRADEHLGAIVAFALTLVWIGRRHWALILRQAVRGVRQGEPRGRYLSYPVAFWTFLGCSVVMGAWLVAAGSTLAGAVVSVALLLLGFLVITRIIAETGLVHGQLFLPLTRPWTLLATYGYAHAVPERTFYLASLLHGTHFDYREVVPVYASHSLKLADQTLFDSRSISEDTRQDRRLGRGLMGCLVLALVVGYVVSFASTLWTEYRYAWTQEVTARPLNSWGAVTSPQQQILDHAMAYHRGVYRPPYDPLTHLVGGFGFTSLLAFLRLRFAHWPLHPVGYLMLGTFPAAHLWFSIFWGWLAKVLVLRFGGASLYQSAKPFFLGLIVGEPIAAGAWLVVGIALNAAGIPYRPINIMPG